MYKEDLALNNQQWLMYHETKTNPTKKAEKNKNEIEVNI